MGAIEREQPPQPPTRTHEQLNIPPEAIINRELLKQLEAIGVIGTIGETVKAGKTPAKWQALFVGGPRKREDGSFDPTLQIIINNRPLTSKKDPLKPTYITVCYSPEKVLMIRGAETTFKGVVTRENADKDAISTALKKALTNPRPGFLPPSLSPRRRNVSAL